MRNSKGFALALAFAAAAASARAAAPIRLAVPELAFAPAASPAILPPAAAGFSPSLSAAPAGLAPSLLPPPPQASPLRTPPAAGRPSILRALDPAPAAGGSAAADDLAGRYADFFDGAAPAKDGDAVSPRLAEINGRTLRQPLQLDAVRGAVARALPALRDSVALGGWNGPRTTLDESCCGDAAPKLALLLRAQGVPARLVEAEFHYYVILDLPDGQIVVDPTVRQFFGKKQAPRAVPHVFVGTIGDLNSFFQRHAGSKTTKYDPQRIYFRDSVVREGELLALEAKVRAGGDPDHGPLRRFLGLP